MVSNSSFPPSKAFSDQKANRAEDKDPPSDSASVFLLPSFKYIPSIPTDANSVEAFIKAYILPKKLHHSYDTLSEEQRSHLLQQPELQHHFTGVRNVDEILILICGHGGRDDRCGKLAPVLTAEFEEKLRRQNISILTDTPSAELTLEAANYFPPARIASISHIGGHKFAGNVIVYIPPSFSSNPLAGKGIWYGRVAPEHVEGIVQKTILEGTVIKEHFRGGIGADGEVLRL